MRIVLLVLMLTLFAGCGQMQVAEHDVGLVRHYVKKGETLYAIARHYNVDFHEVAIWNEIDPPYEIYIDQELVIIAPYDQLIPTDEIEVAEQYKEPEKEPNKELVTEVKPPQVNTYIPPKEPIKVVRANTPKAVVKNTQKWTQPKFNSSVKGGVSWQWPHTGNISRGFNPRAGKKGVDIKGKINSEIFAAANGVVVYSGNNLKGYGNLLIIRHSKEYLSAYGHNSKILVKKDMEVKKGQKIALMGVKQGTGALLHFEVRKNGKPVNPMRILPAK